MFGVMLIRPMEITPDIFIASHMFYRPFIESQQLGCIHVLHNVFLRWN